MVTRTVSASTDPIAPGAWQNIYRTSVTVTGMTQPGEKPVGKTGFDPASAVLEEHALPLDHGGGVHRSIVPLSYQSRANRERLHVLVNLGDGSSQTTVSWA